MLKYDQPLCYRTADTLLNFFLDPVRAHACRVTKMTGTCYYELLGVGPKASAEEIRKGHRKAIKQWHPDKNPDRIEEATARFKEIQNAHDILSDPDERYRYDVKKAIDDILDEDETESFVPMWHITEQLTAKFPDIPSLGFEGAEMQVWIGDQVEASQRYTN